jgi:chromosome segregation ATPase
VAERGNALLDFVRALDDRDRELAVTLAQLDAAGEEAAAVRRRGEEIRALHARLPHERERLERETDDARRALEEEGARLGEAQAALARAREADNEAEQAVRRRALSAAEARARSAEDHLGRLERERERLEDDARRAEGDVPVLADRARRAASILASLPAVGEPPLPSKPRLQEVLEWAARARTAVFVARGNLGRERESLIRQASETAASAVGDPLLGANVSLVRAQLERALDDRVEG